MRNGSHLLRVRVQDRRRDALVCPEPQNRCEQQADGRDDQRKPDLDPILCHVITRGTSSPGPPYTLSRAPLRRRASASAEATVENATDG